MILTGSEIQTAFANGDIMISPFEAELVNPNSYNYRLGASIKKWVGQKYGQNVFESIILPKDGYVLDPHIMYLGNTYETIGSDQYAMSLIGRSSLGRLGLFLQISANLGHTTSCHKWTLEIVATRPIRIYPQMKIGQVSFWENKGDLLPSTFTYANYNEPQESVLIPGMERIL